LLIHFCKTMAALWQAVIPCVKGPSFILKIYIEGCFCWQLS
jgi:hypothetical protein